jgi:hypothetical protein
MNGLFRTGSDKLMGIRRGGDHFEKITYSLYDIIQNVINPTKKTDIPRLKGSLFWIFIHSCSVWFFSLFLAGLASNGLIINGLTSILIIGLGITTVAKIVRQQTRKIQFKINIDFFIWVGISAFSFWITQFILISIFSIETGILYFILMGCGVYLISLVFIKSSNWKFRTFRHLTNNPKKWVSYGENIKIEKEIFSFVNKERNKRNIHIFSWNNSLYEIAQKRAKEITRNFSHQGVPAGCGENIAMIPIGNVKGLGFIHRHNVAKAFLKTWMNSSGHRENILRGQYNTCCIGVVKHKGKYFGVQLFS